MPEAAMPVEIVTIPCLKDNYAYLVHDPATKETLLVDAPEAGPIEAALAERGWRLGAILITHHHADHIDGVAALRGKTGAIVVGARADRDRLPDLDVALAPGDVYGAGDLAATVIDAPGHTIGHVAFYLPAASALFSGDSLMVMGCGRLFEGTPAQMWETLERLCALPDETLLHSGHEYALSNIRFALSVDPDNPDLRRRAGETEALRHAGRATVPARLDHERATNPFLRAGDAAMKDRLGMSGGTDLAVFAELRRRKDVF
jgi:hydroxyacylglutathione hydrolase